MNSEPCTIGKGIVIKGNITGSDNLAIEGRIEGHVALTSHLAIKGSGVVIADVDVAELTVDGELKGNIRSVGAVQINDGAKVLGDVSASHILLEEGARFKGRIEMDFDMPDID